MIWATVSSQSCFGWLYRPSLSLTIKNIVNLISVLTIWSYPCVESFLVLLQEDICYNLQLCSHKLNKILGGGWFGNTVWPQGSLRSGQQYPLIFVLLYQSEHLGIVLAFINILGVYMLSQYMSPSPVLFYFFLSFFFFFNNASHLFKMFHCVFFSASLT